MTQPNATELPAPIPAWLQMIVHEQIAPWKNQPRTIFNEEAHKELVASMAARGFDPAFPLIVRPLNKLRIDERESALEPGRTEYAIEEEQLSGNWREVDCYFDHEKAALKMSRLQRFEIAAGERRWRAAKERGITEIPCSVRTLSDREMLELALVENLQHESMSEMEEARGYARLVEFGDTHEQIAERIGKTSEHVRHRLALLRVAGTATGKALEQGKITPSHARVIAKVPASQRDELLQKVLKPALGPGPLPVAELVKLVNLDYVVELRTASFDRSDGTLVPVEIDQKTNERVRGGACDDCPLVDKVTRTHLCTNTECFRAKTAADFANWAKLNHKPDEKRTVLSYEENKRALNPAGTALALNSPFVRLTEVPANEEDLKRGVTNPPAWKKLLKGTDCPVVILRTSKGDEWEVVDRRVALAAAREAEKGKPAAERIFKTVTADEPTTPAAGTSTSDSFPGIKREEEDKAKALAEARARQVEQAVKLATYRAIVEASGKLKLPEEFIPLATTALLDCIAEHGDEADLIELCGWQLKADEVPSDCVRRNVKKLEGNFRGACIGALLLLMHLPSARDEQAPKWAKSLKVDTKAIRKKVEAECKARFAAEDEKKEAAEGIVWGCRKELPELFTWNANNCAVNPDEATIVFPKAAVKAKVTATVRMALDDKGWHLAIECHTNVGGQCAPVNRTSTGYGSRELALRTGLLEIEDIVKKNGANAAALKCLAELIAAAGKKKGGAK